jgi:hypothetical protein
MSISVKKFVEEFKARGIQNTLIATTAVSDYIKKELNVKKYISFADKREMCKKVLDASCKKVGNIVEVDSVSRYLFFTIAVISKYTDLTFESIDGMDSIDNYDLLCQEELLNPILDCIGVEYTTCNNILNMMMADIDANHNNIAKVTDGFMQGVLDIIDDLVGVLADKVEDLNLDLNQIDIKKYSGLLERFIK